MAHKLPPHVHRKTAKGLVYLYFDTGRVTPAGKPIRVRLPDFGAAGFWQAYNACERDRNRDETPSALLVPGFCEAFRNSPRFKAKAKSTRESYETYLRVIEEQFDTFPADSVEPKDVATLLNKMSDRPGAANQCVRVLSALYSWGKSPAVGLVTSNPATGAELFKGGEHQPWPTPLLDAALKADDLLIRRVVALLYYTGQRIGDVCAMRWSDIQGDHVAVKQEKTGAELQIRLHRDLASLLREIPRSLTTIIAKPDGTPYHKATIRELLKAWAAERGVKAVPHGLRKNAVNALLEAECSVAEVNAVTGQSLQMIEHYAKRRDRKRLSGSAVAKLEAQEK